MKIAERDRLAASTDEVKSAIDTVWSAYRSILSKEGKIGYVSMAITSGTRMYDVLDSHGVATLDELKAKDPSALIEQIVKPNVQSGGNLARMIAASVDCPVIAPSIFQAKKPRWSQDEYMAMWLRMIEENVGWIYMAPGWEYSNGGAEEFLHAVQMALGYKSRADIEILDPAGKAVRLHDGLHAIAMALLNLRQRKRKAPVLADVCKAVFTLRDAAVVKAVRDPHCAHDQNFLGAIDLNVIDSLRKDLVGILREDYGVVLTPGIDLNTGVPRKNDATPEGILLKEEPKPEEPKQ